MEAFAVTQASLRCPTCATLSGPLSNHGYGSAIDQGCSVVGRTFLSGKTALLHEAYRKTIPQNAKRVVWVRAKKGKSSTSGKPSRTVSRKKVTEAEKMSVLRDNPWILVDVSVSGERHAEVYEKVLANQRKARGFAPGRPSLKEEVDSIVHSTLVRQVSAEIINAMPFVLETPASSLYFIVDENSKKKASEDPSADFKYSLLLHVDHELMNFLIQMGPFIKFMVEAIKRIDEEDSEFYEQCVIDTMIELWETKKDDKSILNTVKEQMMRRVKDDFEVEPRYWENLPDNADISIQWGFRETDRNYWGRMYPDIYSPEAELSFEYFFDGLDNPVVNTFKAAAEKVTAVKDATNYAKEAVGGWISRLPFVNAKQKAEEQKKKQEEDDLRLVRELMEGLLNGKFDGGEYYEGWRVVVEEGPLREGSSSGVATAGGGSENKGSNGVEEQQKPAGGHVAPAGEDSLATAGDSAAAGNGAPLPAGGDTTITPPPSSEEPGTAGSDSLATAGEASPSNGATTSTGPAATDQKAPGPVEGLRGGGFGGGAKGSSKSKAKRKQRRAEIGAKSGAKHRPEPGGVGPGEAAPKGGLAGAAGAEAVPVVAEGGVGRSNGRGVQTAEIGTPPEGGGVTTSEGQGAVTTEDGTSRPTEAVPAEDSSAVGGVQTVVENGAPPPPPNPNLLPPAWYVVLDTNVYLLPEERCALGVILEAAKNVHKARGGEEDSMAWWFEPPGRGEGEPMPLVLIHPLAVVYELEGLKGADGEVGEKARSARRLTLQACVKEEWPWFRVQKREETVSAEEMKFLALNADNAILAGATYYRRNVEAPGKVILLTNDIDMQIRAKGDSIQAMSAREFKKQFVNPGRFQMLSQPARAGAQVAGFARR